MFHLHSAVQAQASRAMASRAMVSRVQASRAMASRAMASRAMASRVGTSKAMDRTTTAQVSSLACHTSHFVWLDVPLCLLV